MIQTKDCLGTLVYWIKKQNLLKVYLNLYKDLVLASITKQTALSTFHRIFHKETLSKNIFICGLRFILPLQKLYT